MPLVHHLNLAIKKNTWLYLVKLRLLNIAPKFLKLTLGPLLIYYFTPF